MWPLPLRLIHWISAALVIGALGLGTYMVWFVENPAARFDLTQTHKSIGVMVFALTLARLWLRILSTAPKSEPKSEPESESEPVASRVLLAAKATHACLYGLLVVLPSSGYLMATTTPVRVPTRVFGLFDLPYVLAADLTTFRFFQAVHVAAALSLTVLIVLHVVAALVHAFWWRDRTMRRMGWKSRGASF
jgi:cytochrome b561